MEEYDGITIGKIKIDDVNELRVRITTFKHNFLDIRKFWDTGDKWVPTKKGSQIPVESIDEFVKLVLEAQKVIKSK